MRPLPLVLMIGFAATLLSAAELHVSATRGADANPGTAEQPFRTIGQAAAVAAPGDLVLVGAGTYRETVVPKASGTEDAPIIYRAVPGEPVIISGTEEITGWQPGEGAIHQAPLAKDFFDTSHNQALQVFVDGAMMTLARWPNSTLDPTRPKKSQITRFVSKSTDEEHKANGNWTIGVIEDEALADIPAGHHIGAEIFFQPNFGGWSWAFTGTVTGQQGKTLTFKTRSGSGKDFSQGVYDPKSRYYLFNRRSLLDAEGEWFHDAQTGTLLLWLPGGAAPADHRIEAKKREFGFDLSGKAHLVVSGFRLFACTITTDNLSGGNNRGYDADGKVVYPWRGTGDGVAPANHLVLERLLVEYPTHFTDASGHFYLQWGQSSGVVLSGSDLVLRDSVIRLSAGNGVTCIGRNNKIVNNLITDVAYAAVDCAAINTGGAAITDSHEFAHNTIRHCGRSGINPRHGNEQRTRPVAHIHHNDISLFGMQDWDVGAIYMFGGDGLFGRINHNWLHDAYPNVDDIPKIGNFTAGGVYPDFGKNFIIDHNVIWNLEWGIHIQNVAGGNPDEAANYIIFNNTVLVKGLSDPLPPYGPFCVVTNSSAKQKGTIIVNNLFACLTDPQHYRPIDTCIMAAKINNLSWDGIAGSPTDPKFANLATFDLTLGEGSPAIDTGKAIQEQVRNGVKIPLDLGKIVGDAPDIGAYEFGVEPWRAGADLRRLPR